MVFSWLNGDVCVGAHPRLAIRDPMFHLVSGLPKGKFSQRNQRRLSKELLQSLFSFRTFVDNSSLQAMQQGPRREIHHHHLVGVLDHPVRHRLTHSNAADVPHLVVEALQVLDVHRGQNINAGV